MHVVIGANPSRYEYKEGLKKHLLSKGHTVTDVSSDEADEAAWVVNICRNVAKAVVKQEGVRGIVVCGTGMGVSIAANKNKGVRCALAENYWAAKQSRRLNNANVMALGADFTSLKKACEMADVFIETEFLEDLEPKRKEKLKKELDVLDDYENTVFR